MNTQDEAASPAHKTAPSHGDDGRDNGLAERLPPGRAGSHGRDIPCPGVNPIASTLYGKYIAERAGGRILESEDGFIVYRQDGRSCYIIEMYILPDRRKSGKGRSLAARLDEIAQEMGCDKITAAIYLEDSGSSNTVVAALASGFKVASAQGNILYVQRNVHVPRVMVGYDQGVEVIPYDHEKHYHVIASWFEKRSFPAPDPALLPETGAVACIESSPIACGFLFRTDSSVASIAHLGSNPDSKGSDRNKALNVIMMTLSSVAKSQGFRSVTCATNLPKLKSRFLELGFEQTDENLTLFRRSLCQQAD